MDDTCTCGMTFRTAEDWRDHMPCPGNETDRLRLQVKKLTDEITLYKLRYPSFWLDQSEREKLAVWMEDQERRIEGMPQGAIGGAYTYSFTPTSIGMVIKVKNALTNEEIDVTDYDNW